MLLPWLTIFDFGTFRANFIKPIDLTKVRTRSSDFALLVPIFNDLKYLTNIEFLKKYSSRVVLCTTTNEKPEFITELNDLCKKHGFRARFSEVGGGKKNPWAIYNKTLLAHDAVLKDSIVSLEEKYVIFIDGDTFVDGELETLVGAAEENNFDLSSVKVLPTLRTNIIEKLQGIEYDIAMQARLIYPWLTSGAGMVAKRSVMMEIMKNHSLFFNGGDIEIGKLADMMGYKVGHLPMVFYTDVPSTFYKWFKQRFSWICGCFRHSIINIDHQLRHPFHFLYFTLIIYFLLPLKMFEMWDHLHLIPLIILIYVALTYLANWKVRSKWMLLFPFYALFQVFVIIWFGIYRYLYTVYKSKNIGKIKMVNNPNNISLFNPKHGLPIVGNVILIFVCSITILLGSSPTMQTYAFGRHYEPMEVLIMGKNKAAKLARNRNLNTGNAAGSVYSEGSYMESDITSKYESVADDKIYYIDLKYGDGRELIARRAIIEFINSTESLTEEQLLYAEYKLGDIIDVPQEYLPGVKIGVNESDIKNSIGLAIERFK